MKRLVRITSFSVGIAALIWAMRDRFISLALPREPQPPAFRHPDDHPHVAHHPHQAVPKERNSAVQHQAGSIADNLETIKGIGAVYASKLNGIGINSFADLADASAEAIAAQLDTSQLRVSDWIDQAKLLL